MYWTLSCRVGDANCRDASRLDHVARLVALVATHRFVRLAVKHRRRCAAIRSVTARSRCSAGLAKRRIPALDLAGRVTVVYCCTLTFIGSWNAVGSTQSTAI